MFVHNFSLLNLSTGSFTFQTVSEEKKMVTVPPGHKIEMYGPAPTPHLSQLKPGVYIADFGRVCNIGGFFAGVEKLSIAIDSNQKPIIVWIIQDEFISRLEASEFYDVFVEKLKLVLDNNPLARTVVLPLQAIYQASFRRKLHELGAKIHTSTDEGACVVQIFKPNGETTIGAVGAAVHD